MLFYRRRTESPLGGKTHEKIEQARLKSNKDESESEHLDDMTVDSQLPTPPSEEKLFGQPDDQVLPVDHWVMRSQPSVSNIESSGASPSPPLPSLDDSHSNDLFSDPLLIASRRFDFPEPQTSGRASPSSSNEAEVGDTDVDDMVWDEHSLNGGTPDASSGRVSPSSSTDDGYVREDSQAYIQDDIR